MSGQQYGQRVREARQTARLTQAAVAARVGVSNVHISEIERGTRTPGHELATRIEQTLGVRYDATPEIARLRRIAAAAAKLVEQLPPNSATLSLTPFRLSSYGTALLYNLRDALATE